MKKVLIYSIITFVVLGFFSIAAISIQAESIDENHPPIIQKLTERFNLNVDEVKGLFDENRRDHREIMQKRLIESGLTEEQIEVLQIKREELRERKMSLKNLSFEERQVKMEEMREEMKVWAEENGIDLSVCQGLNYKFSKGFNRGFKHFSQ